MTADLTNPIFTNEEAARKHFEAIRWPDGVTCPHCGVIGEATAMQGKSTRPGLWKCRACVKPFTATMGTLYERSHIPLHKWLLATHLMAASKKGISAHQLWRMLGFGSYRTAWFMSHRIREGMAPLKAKIAPLGGEGKIVEADTTYIGGASRLKDKDLLHEFQAYRDDLNELRCFAIGLHLSLMAILGGKGLSQSLPERPSLRAFPPAKNLETKSRPDNKK